MKLLREPLLHFAIAGAVLFAGYQWVNRDRLDTVSVEPVRVGEGEVRWLSETFTKQWTRPPTAAELNGLIAEFVNEELLAREALEMGLDKDDTIIRRRLAQKLNFLVDDTTRLIEPTDQELRGYYEANAERFTIPAKVSFTQIYFNPERRQDATSDATVALASLRGPDGGGLVASIGDRLLTNSEVRDADEVAVSGMFGPEFSHQVFALEPGVWSGPLKSSFGFHLVEVSAISPAKQSPYEEVREALKQDWLREKQEFASKEYVARLREKYGVVVDESVRTLLQLPSTRAQ
jgi:hypothetical protein